MWFNTKAIVWEVFWRTALGVCVALATVSAFTWPILLAIEHEEEQMKIKIEFSVDNAAFEQDVVRFELRNVMEQAIEKAVRQMRRRAGTVCDAPEADDVLLDSNGNTIGTVRVVRGGR